MLLAPTTHSADSCSTPNTKLQTRISEHVLFRSGCAYGSYKSSFTDLQAQAEILKNDNVPSSETCECK